MNSKATDSSTRSHEEEGGRVFIQPDHAYIRVPAKLLRRSVALPLRRAFETDSRRTLREEIVFHFRFDDRHVASHKFREALRARAQRQQEDEED